MKSLSRVQLLATPWTAAYQAPPPMGWYSWNFPGGPVVKTLHFQCRGHRFDPWAGNIDPACHKTQPSPPKKKHIYRIEMPASDLLTQGTGAVVQTTERLSRSVPHSLGLYVGFVWRGTQRIPLNLLFIHISFLLIYLSAWFSVFIPALVLNQGEKSPEISSPKWCQAWQRVQPWGIIFLVSKS